MNWARYRKTPWVDTRASFVACLPAGGSLLDVGCSTGQTLRHFIEIRPDMKFSCVDINDVTPHVPPGVFFKRADVISDRLPFADNSFEGVTMLHILEHLRQDGTMGKEISRVIKPGGLLLVEGPSSRAVRMPHLSGGGPFNFYDDPTHVRPITVDRVANAFVPFGLKMIRVGRSRSWPLTLALPWTLIINNRLRVIAGLSSLLGCNLYMVLQKTGDSP